MSCNARGEQTGGGFEQIPLADEMDMVRRAQKGDRRAKNDLWRKCHRYVRGMCASLCRGHGREHGFTEADLIEEAIAVAGVAFAEKALPRFDADKGVRFLTYAHHWMASAVQSFLGRGSRGAIKAKAAVAVALADGEMVSAEQLAERLHVTKVTAETVIAKMTMRRLSADAPQTSGSKVGPTLGDTLADPAPTAEEQLVAASEDRLRRRAVRRAVRQLGPKERTILMERMGDDAQTYREMGPRFNLSHETVRKIEHQAIAVVRVAVERDLRAIDPALVEAMRAERALPEMRRTAQTAQPESKPGQLQLFAVDQAG